MLAVRLSDDETIGEGQYSCTLSRNRCQIGEASAMISAGSSNASNIRSGNRRNFPATLLAGKIVGRVPENVMFRQNRAERILEF